MAKGAKYLESFEINGRGYGIEDFEDGQPDEEHFFGVQRRKRKEPRFMLWAGGCGIGKAKTLEEARRNLHTYICSHLSAEANGYRGRLQKAEAAIKRMGSDPARLFRFSHTVKE